MTASFCGEARALSGKMGGGIGMACAQVHTADPPSSRRVRGEKATDSSAHSRQRPPLQLFFTAMATAALARSVAGTEGSAELCRELAHYCARSFHRLRCSLCVHECSGQVWAFSPAASRPGQICTGKLRASCYMIVCLGTCFLLPGVPKAVPTEPAP